MRAYGNRDAYEPASGNDIRPLLEPPGRAPTAGGRVQHRLLWNPQQVPASALGKLFDEAINVLWR